MVPAEIDQTVIRERQFIQIVDGIAVPKVDGLVPLPQDQPVGCRAGEKTREG